jgi:predicted nucleotide-binding protein (sugar kinase/HSP70/actin superfamily)
VLKVYLKGMMLDGEVLEISQKELPEMLELLEPTLKDELERLEEQQQDELEKQGRLQEEESKALENALRRGLAEWAEELGRTYWLGKIKA